MAEVQTMQCGWKCSTPLLRLVQSHPRLFPLVRPPEARGLGDGTVARQKWPGTLKDCMEQRHCTSVLIVTRTGQGCEHDKLVQSGNTGIWGLLRQLRHPSCTTYGGSSTSLGFTCLVCKMVLTPPLSYGWCEG